MTHLLRLAEIQEALHESARDVLRRWLAKLPDGEGRIMRCQGCGCKVWLPKATTMAMSAPTRIGETMAQQARRLHSRCGGAMVG
jgi:hypothetical protein